MLPTEKEAAVAQSGSYEQQYTGDEEEGERAISSERSQDTVKKISDTEENRKSKVVRVNQQNSEISGFSLRDKQVIIDNLDYSATHTGVPSASMTNVRD